MTAAKAQTARPQSPSGPAADPAPDDVGYFNGKDGTRLYCEWFAPAGKPRAAALVLHGYAEHCGRYHELARVLTGSGLAVLSYDFRGHGQSDGQRGHADRFRDFIDDMEAALRELDRRCAAGGMPTELPVLLVGHSHGSLTALRSIADPTREPTRVRAAVLSSPFLGLKHKVNPVKEALGRVAGLYAPKLSMPNELRIEHLTHDPDKLAARRADTLCHEVATARWYTAALRAHQYIQDNIVRVEVPTLWLVAGGDRIADPVATRAAHARLRAPSIYREFPRMHHEVFNEVDRADAFELVKSFVDQHFPA